MNRRSAYQTDTLPRSSKKTLVRPDTWLVWGMIVLSLLIMAGDRVSAQEATTPTPLAPETGKLIADTGFRPAVDGFNFPNYNNSIGAENLTADEMRALFGDQ